MSPLLFLPLVVVVALALFKFPPFTAIFIGALVAGLLGALIAPERVISFAKADSGTGLIGFDLRDHPIDTTGPGCINIVEEHRRAVVRRGVI
jgi:hypothetical protein